MTRFTLPARLGAAALAAAGLWAGGCGRAANGLSGTVTYHGAPLKSGSVVLHGADDTVYTALIDATGRYAIANVPPGRFRVSVKSHTVVPVNFRFGAAPPAAVNGPKGVGGTPTVAAVPAIPERFGVPEESGLAVTVDRDTTYDIDVSR